MLNINFVRDLIRNFDGEIEVINSRVTAVKFPQDLNSRRAFCEFSGMLDLKLGKLTISIDYVGRSGWVDSLRKLSGENPELKLELDNLMRLFDFKLEIIAGIAALNLNGSEAVEITEIIDSNINWRGLASKPKIVRLHGELSDKCKIVQNITSEGVEFLAFPGELILKKEVNRDFVLFNRKVSSSKEIRYLSLYKTKKDDQEIFILSDHHSSLLWHSSAGIAEVCGVIGDGYGSYSVMFNSIGEVISYLSNQLGNTHNEFMEEIINIFSLA